MNTELNAFLERILRITPQFNNQLAAGSVAGYPTNSAGGDMATTLHRQALAFADAYRHDPGSIQTTELAGQVEGSLRGMAAMSTIGQADSERLMQALDTLMQNTQQ